MGAMARGFLIGSAVLGGTAVIAGALGAHGLEGRLDADALRTWELASRYQMAHALALLGVAVVPLAAWRGANGADAAKPRAAWRAAGWLFILGVLIFCGSLYLLALTGITWLGAITPIGGTALIAGWAALLVAAVRMR